MKQNLLLLFLITLALSGCTPPVHQFFWIEGTWEMPLKKGGVRLESWKINSWREINGKGLKVVGQDTALLEQLQIKLSKGQFSYISMVPDQNEGKPIAFKMVSSDSMKFVFKNLEHDFPQRIVYRFCPMKEHEFSAGDTLKARVESVEGKGIDFMFFRKSGTQP